MIGRFLCSKIGILDDHFLETILSMTKAIIDISGYEFSTKWGVTDALYYYLNKLFIARVYKIPYYIMPQSFYQLIISVVNGRFCPQSVRNFCPIVAGFNAGTYKVPACVL